MVEFIRVTGSQSEKPKTIETGISQYYVYIRENIEPLYEKDENGVYKLDENEKMIQIGWTYDEAKLLNDNYIVEQLAEHEEKLQKLQEDNEQLKADNEQLKEDNLILMGGMTDMFEVLLSVGV